MSRHAVSAEKYEFLYDKSAQGGFDLRMRQVARQRVKTVKAGDMLYIASFPLWNTMAQGQQARGCKPTREAQRAINQRNRRLHLEQMVHLNFGKGDYFFTATYTERPHGNVRLGEEYYRDEPRDEQEAQSNVRKFIRALRRLVKQKGGDGSALKYLYITEQTQSRHPDPAYEQERYHHHMFIGREAGNGVELTRDEIEQTWARMPFASGRTRCDYLQPDRVTGLSGVAGYFLKSEKGEQTGRDKTGRSKRYHRYAGSKNLKKPRATVADHKISSRRVERLAADVRASGKEIFEKLYPGYALYEEPVVKVSDYVAGAYIYARMVRKEGGRTDDGRTGQAALCDPGAHGKRGADSAV